jgi:predicted DNA-binding protein (UPF0251 family)/predicted Fe-Mo cluster-binding NifX family protein
MSFEPGEESADGAVVLNVDEYETIRLVDLEKLTHGECASRMGVSRSTVTDIYESARQKIADCLVNGRRLIIAGGDYMYDVPSTGTEDIKKKGTEVMRVAVTYDNGDIFQHFGHTEMFKLYDVKEGKAEDAGMLSANGSGHGALASLLRTADADALICGGIGPGAQQALAEEGIKLYAGVTGSADEAAKALAEGTLEYSGEANCSHHSHEGGGSCGSHGHGHGSCGGSCR